MLSSSRRLIYTLSNKIRKKDTETVHGDKLVVDFTKTQKSPFDIKSESSYNSYLSNGSLMLGLKKSNFIAWVEIPEQEYRDHVIKAKIRIDSLGGYASAGIIFHADEDSYYLALVSNKGYFRLDAVKDGAPKALIAWTDIPDFDETNIELNIITYGTFLIFIVNGKWVGEISDDSIGGGRIGFVLASYEAASDEATSEAETGAAGADALNAGITGVNEYTCKAWLDYLSIDTQIKSIEEQYEKWSSDSNINANSRLRLAETFAVMGKSSKALDQIKKAWKKRDDVIGSIATTYTEARTKKELLLAARMSLDLGQYGEAEEFIDSIIDQWPASAEGKLAHTEKIKILNELNKFKELKKFVSKHPGNIEKNIDYYTMLARCHWELKEYKASAKAWEKAFNFNRENGVYAVNAANALELIGKHEEALALFLEAGKIFLKQDNSGELTAMMPKLSSLGSKNIEARVLAGKIAFSIEDYSRCEAEFDAAEKLRCAMKPRPKADPALYYLWGLVLSIKNKNKEAIRLLEKAVKLAPDYGLFRFKLAELKIISGIKDPNLVKELKYALELIGDDPEGKMANHAGNLLLETGDAKNAKYFFDMAKNQ
ncbi:MAG: hypothetical protein LBQ93_02685 [Treponema sp.]|jgi:tetratricopeptide (TPR) repeat protein|nr:hypothetical protein [Treponema sp.]